MFAVETKELTRVYRGRGKNPDVVALDAVSMTVEEGEVHGLLGPNGAGKTTLVKVLCTVLLPTEGSASVLGYDLVRDTSKVRPLIGMVFGGDRGFYWRLTGRENLEYWAALYKVPSGIAKRRASELLERVGLADRAGGLVETDSRGMRQRLHLARALIANARLLFLDEPTSAMDPIVSREFRELVKDLRSEGRTIILTTHDMAEAESVCDRVTLIDRGHILAVETPRSLGTLIAQHERIDFEGSPDGLIERLRELSGVASVDEMPGAGHRVELSDGAATRSVLETLVESGVTSVRTSRPSLEEVYMHVMGGRGINV